MAKVVHEACYVIDRFSESISQSAIVRQMAELADEPSSIDAESVSAVRDVAECLQLLSQAWPTAADSTDISAVENTPSVVGELSELPEPSFITSRFEIRRLLGHGGFGVVLLAFDTRLEREVALKVPRPEILVSSDLRGRFLREAQAAAALDHPNIVPIYDTGEIGPVWFITSRYVAGPTLAEWFHEQGSPLCSKQAAELLAVLADAVHHAHSRGVLHRDLKPANVLLEPNQGSSNGHLPFTPRLSDFGLARRLDEAEQVTRDTSLVGTPRYMAPEQAACRHNEVGIQSDVYGLGVILYELLTGSPPHRGENDIEILRHIIDEPVSTASLNQRRIPRDLQAICIKCLQKLPSCRYDTAGELAADLRRFLFDEPVTARVVSRSERLIRWSRRRPMQAALCAALCIVSVAGVAGITWQWYRAEKNVALAKMQSTRAEENLRYLELAFIDLAWVFDEAELWSGSDDTFLVLLEVKLRRYADEMFPQYLKEQQLPKPIAAALFAMNAKYASLKGTSATAEQNFRKSLGLWREVLHENPERAEVARAFAITLFGYASHLVNSGGVSEGISDFQLVQQMIASLNLPQEGEVKALETYADLMSNLGYARARRGRTEEAIKSHRLANQIWHDLAQRSPNASFRVMEAMSLSFLATRHDRVVKDFLGALSKTRQARRLLEEAVYLEPDQRDWQFILAATLRDEAHFSNRIEGPSRAMPLFEQSIDVYRSSLGHLPADSPQREAFGNVNLELAQIAYDARGHVSSLSFYEACAEAWSELLSTGDLSKDSEGRLAMVYAQIGEINARDGKSGDAIAAFRRSITVAENLCKLPNAPRKATTALIQSNAGLGDLLHREGQLAEALDCLHRTVTLLQKQSTIRPKNLNFKEQLRIARARLAAFEPKTVADGNVTP